MTIRSLCFYRARAVLSSNTIVYTVPLGFTLIWKSTLAHNVGGSSIQLQLQLLNAAQNTAPFAVNATLASGADVNQQCYYVLNPGDEILANTGGAPVDIWLSGSLLAGSAPNLPA